MSESLTLKEVLNKYSEGPQTGIFTDGGARPNPGPGGWGLVWVENGEIRQQLHGQDLNTTNNRMEYKALIEAFNLISKDQAVTIYMDSQLCLNTLTIWAKNWEKNGWKKKSGEIKNLEIVKEAYYLYLERPLVELKWIAAHKGWLWNEYVDSLASAWTRTEL